MLSWSVNKTAFSDVSDLWSKHLEQPLVSFLEILENLTPAVGQMEKGRLFPLTDGSPGQSALRKAVGLPSAHQSQIPKGTSLPVTAI